MENKFDWIPFYKELAEELLTYKDRSDELFCKMKKIAPLHEKFNYLHFFDEDGWWSDRRYRIDPFNIFATFNRDMKIENKIAITEILANEFDIKSAIPTNFDGIPYIHNRKSHFNGVDELWILFEETLKYSNTNIRVKAFQDAFENCLKLKDNGLVKLTTIMFCIAPDTYVALDSQNTSFFENNSEMASIYDLYSSIKDKKKFTADKYLDICIELKEIIKNGEFDFKSITEFSHFAWESRWQNKVENINLEPNFRKWLSTLINSKGREYEISTINAYCAALRSTPSKLNISKDIKRNKVFSYEQINEFDSFCNHIQKADNLQEIINKSGNGAFMKALELYRDFLETESAEDIGHAWYVGAIIDGVEKINEFIQEGKWVNGYDDKYVDLVNSIKEGDRIVIKSTFTQKNNLPFNANNKIVSVMRLKSIGVVTKNLLDGKNLLVDWQDTNVNKDWYFYTARTTIWKVVSKEDDWMQKALLNFTFNDEIQNYERFLENPYWNEKYFEIEDSEELVKSADEYEKYSKDEFLKEVFIDSKSYDTISSLLKRKKNIILQGAPGVGKSFAAQKLAYSIMGIKDKKRVQMIQFHQSYAYEDFIMGYRPNDEGFKLEYGAFYKFCKTAQIDSERKYFFIIDEINRGNLSKIFGELFMLIEHDKRDERNSMRLLYADEQFYIPSNVHIIGMMNTADRSLAMLDYALRRRFAFFEMEPAFNSDGFKQYQDTIKNEKFNKLIEVVKNLNEDIKKDASLGAGFRIGHSYFIKNDSDVIDNSWLEAVVNYEVIPLISEYWFDEISKVEEWSKKLLEAIL